jgi:TonB family protein
VQATGSDFRLVFTGAMQGEVAAGAGRWTLEELRAGGRAGPAALPGAFSFAIPPGADIRVAMGPSTFRVRSVPAPRPLAGSLLAQADWRAQRYTGLSLAAHTALLALVLAVPPGARALTAGLSAGRDVRLTRVDPAPAVADEVPPWLKKRRPQEEGGGRSHAGEEGRMGSPEADEAEGLHAVKGPEHNPDPHLARRLAESAARSAGVLGLLQSPSGSHIASIFGRDSALGADAESALGGLMGDQVGEAYGIGGLGVASTGRGGGGTGEGTVGLGPLGTLGKGGGPGGGPGGEYGRVGPMRPRPKPRAPRRIVGRADVHGALDRAIIRRVVRRHINEVRYCYEKELPSSPGLYGRVVARFTIAPNGRVMVARIKESTMGSPTVEGCIVKAVRRWQFPKPEGGGIVVVSYPFVLKTSGAGR